MYYSFRVTNERKCVSVPISVEGDSLQDAYVGADILFPTEDGWVVECTEDR